LNLLVLGSCGFIGSNICKYFTNKNYAVTGCDLIEYSTGEYTYHKISVLSSDFETLFADNKFDVCINASGSGNVGYSIAHPQSDFDGNTIAVAKILDAIRKYQPACRLLHISSAAVYGNPSALPVNESAVPSPVSPYGYHKLMSEILCREYSEIYNVPVLVIRPFSVYGNGLRKQLLWDICQKLIHADNIELFGTGNETRDFIHIDDILKLMELLIEKTVFDGNVFNVGSGVQTSIKNIAAFFVKYFPGNKEILFSGNSKKGDPINWQADISKIKALGFNPVHNLEQQIKSYINWFCNIQGQA
jgi:dTDP-glucose 4,6-dehydratase/UDP-glucose 4-epimerase